MINRENRWQPPFFFSKKIRKKCCINVRNVVPLPIYIKKIKTVDTGNMLWFDRASKKPDLLLRITVLEVIELLRFCRQMRIGVCLRC